jgi:hypothetical protein
MTRSSISIFLLVVGLLWAAVVSWFFVTLVLLGGAPNLAYIAKALLWYSWLFVGPLLLIAGAILSLMGTHQRAGSVLSLVGCAILTLMVGYQSLAMLKDLSDPLIIKPPYGKWVFGIILTLLADAGAVQLYRLVSLAVSK